MGKYVAWENTWLGPWSAVCDPYGDLGNFDDSEVDMKLILAFLIAALSGMGVGGGGLFALYLKYFSDYEQIQIQAVHLYSLSH